MPARAPRPADPAHRTPPAQAVSVRGVARRQAILDAASEVFLERGFERASVGDIVQRSGGSLATLYALFGSKEGLFAAIVAQISAAALEPFAAPDFESRPLDEALQLFGERFLGTILGPGALRWQRMCVAEGPKFPELRTALCATGTGHVRERFAAYLAAQAKAGRLRVPDPLLAARHFVALLKSDTHLAALCGEPVAVPQAEIARQVRRAVAVFLYGYAVPAAAAVSAAGATQKPSAGGKKQTSSRRVTNQQPTLTKRARRGSRRATATRSQR